MINPRVLVLTTPGDLTAEFRKVGVDAGGISIMRAKGFSHCIKISRLPVFPANILKQEMLSLGADAALSRWSLTGGVKATDCILMANRVQFERLFEKLKKQPFGLSRLGVMIKDVLRRADAATVPLTVAGRMIRLGRRTRLMGIINATPDSFSGDGLYGRGAERVLALAQGMVAQGADMLDLGGASSRPGALPVSAKEEIGRVVPILKAFKDRIRVPVSIDTDKSDVAAAALDLGVSIVNDISALRHDRRMAKVVRRTHAAVVLMHMRGRPRSMQKNPVYKDVMGEIFSFLSEAKERALEVGIPEDKIILDPGIGFGKTTAHNVEILQRLGEFRSLGRPMLVGVSRKSFIGRILDAKVNERLWGTAAAVALAISGGAHIVRVHDVAEMSQVARLADALTKKDTDDVG